VSKFLRLLFQKIASKIYQEHLETKHAELHYQVIDVFKEHYNNQDKSSVFWIFKGSKINLFRFVNFNVDKLFARVNKL
jgi:hypothetical protein